VPDNLPYIPIPRNTWVNLYALSGITVGQPIVVENVGVCDISLAVQAAQPAPDHTSYNILKRDDDIRLSNMLGDAGAWAFSGNGIGRISVAEQQGFQPLLKSALHDGSGNPIASLSGAVNVHVADVHTVVVNQYIHQDAAPSTTIAIATVVGDRSFTVVDATGFAANDYVHINTTEVETTLPQIISVVSNVITVDRPLDKAHLIGDVVHKAIVDMALTGQVGTLAAPQIYSGGPPAGVVWHITRLLFSMVHGTAGDLGLFGNLTKLTNGVVLRAKISGQYGTLTNWKTNADIKTDMFDVEFDPRSGGQGNYGTSGRGDFHATGAILRLDGGQGDEFQVLVQDDITALGFFGMKIQGHLEGQ
jgi:hypothetical protein